MTKALCLFRQSPNRIAEACGKDSSVPNRFEGFSNPVESCSNAGIASCFLTLQPVVYAVLWMNCFVDKVILSSLSLTFPVSSALAS
jgi:hypothetical protein